MDGELAREDQESHGDVVHECEDKLAARIDVSQCHHLRSRLLWMFTYHADREAILPIAAVRTATPEEVGIPRRYGRSIGGEANEREEGNDNAQDALDLPALVGLLQLTPVLAGESGRLGDGGDGDAGSLDLDFDGMRWIVRAGGWHSDRAKH